MKVLTVDDEPDILNLLGYNLKKAGYEVIEATDGREAIELAKERLPDLILLDIMLPNMEGTEALKHLKREPVTADIPVIMLTAKGEEIDRVLGFELGAEDYITKPFSPRELILRVKAVLKRTGESNLQADTESKETFTYNELSLDTVRHKVKVSGKSVELTTTEFDLLRVLMAAPGRVFERDSLLNKAWGDDSFVTERTVDTHVRRLRVKLKGAGEYIETVRGVGYRFVEFEEESH